MPNFVKAPDLSMKSIRAGSAFFGSPKLATVQSGSCRSGISFVRIDLWEE
jgi:hypothetical protein